LRVRGPAAPDVPLGGIIAGKRVDVILSCSTLSVLPTGPRYDWQRYRADKNMQVSSQNGAKNQELINYFDEL
jgi:hypothetical protein